MQHNRPPFPPSDEARRERKRLIKEGYAKSRSEWDERHRKDLEDTEKRIALMKTNPEALKPPPKKLNTRLWA
jgi:hypothetical protein